MPISSHFPNLHDPRVSLGTQENAKSTTIGARETPESTQGGRNWKEGRKLRAPRGRFNVKFLSPRVLEKGQHFDQELAKVSNMWQQMSGMETILKNVTSPIWVIVMLILFLSFFPYILHVPSSSCACGWRGTMRVLVRWP